MEKHMSRLSCLVLLILSLLAQTGISQKQNTGIYTFGSYDKHGFDTINLGNLNVHFEIPIVNQKGRGPDFVYSLVYYSVVWANVVSEDGNSQWVPEATWGFHGQLQGAMMGYMTYGNETIDCDGSPADKVSFTYHDAFGQAHLFNYTEIVNCNNAAHNYNTYSEGDGKAFDGSGYAFDLPTHDVRARDGTLIYYGSNPAISDSNGNVISVLDRHTPIRLAWLG